MADHYTEEDFQNAKGALLSRLSRVDVWPSADDHARAEEDARLVLDAVASAIDRRSAARALRAEARNWKGSEARVGHILLIRADEIEASR